MENCCVIRMDLVNSRKLDQREQIQVGIYQYLEQLNQYYHDIMMVPASIILGDEWSIVLKDSSKAYEVYFKVHQFLATHGLRAYTGIGFGSIIGANTEISQLSGTAMERAVYSMKIAKSSKYAYRKEIPTTCCLVYASGLAREIVSGVPCEELLNRLIQNNEILLSKVTKKQYECILLYEQYQSYTEILKHHTNYTKRMLSDGLNKSEYWLIKETKHTIEQLLSGIG